MKRSITCPAPSSKSPKRIKANELHAEQVQDPERIQGRLTSEGQTWKSFSHLSRELRDEIYSHLYHDTRSTRTPYRSDQDDTLGAWSVRYTNAPVCRLLTVGGKQWMSEYLEISLEHMRVDVRLGYWAGSIVQSLPWTESLPLWVRENVRAVRCIVDLNCGEAARETFVETSVWPIWLPRFTGRGTFSSTNRMLLQHHS